MAGFTASVVTAVQNRAFVERNGQPMASSTLLQFVEAVDVLGQAVTNGGSSGGGIQTGGTPLTNQQYQELYEMMF